MSKNLVITIMAAGEGKRMNSSLPKVLHKFNDIPMLVRIIKESLIISNKIIIITGKYDELIKKTINEYILDEMELQKLQYVQQKNPCGTGDAIKSTLHLYNKNELVVILNGDMPLINSKLLNKFIYDGTNNSIMVCNLANPTGYGRIIYENNNNNNINNNNINNNNINNNKFIKIQEEKDCSNEQKNITIVNCGLYKFESELLLKYIPEIKNINNQKEYYLTDILEILINNKYKIDTYLLDESDNKYIMGVNNQEELKKLEEYIL
jgi:bifunctional UDP-N-acetylglucosamine pyrophosphorylase/glucosamine-1-phosphate N-acetyltransferase